MKRIILPTFILLLFNLVISSGHSILNPEFSLVNPTSETRSISTMLHPVRKMTVNAASHDTTPKVIFPNDTKFNGKIYDSTGAVGDSTKVLGANNLGVTTWVNKSGELQSVVENYNQLRSTKGTSLSDRIVVKNFTYIYNNVSYTTDGGVFYKDSSGTENGCTTIVAADSTIWKRVYDNFYPEFFEVGGKDHLGQDVGDKNIERKGIYNDCDRIQSSFKVMGEDIHLHLKPFYKYRVDIQLEVPTNLVLQMNGATIIREDEVAAPMASAYTAGQNVINTSGDISKLRVGQRLFVGGATTNENVAVQSITNISGNTITVTGGTGSAPAGNIARSTILIAKNGNLAEGIIKIYNGIFDGNAINNQTCLSWDNNATIAYGNSISFVLDNVDFYNIPGSNINGGPSCVVSNVYGENIWGDFHHESNGVGGTTIEDGGVFNANMFTNVELRNVGSKFQELGHCEAVFTPSNNTYRLMLNNVTATEVYNMAFAFGTLGGNNYKINNCFFSAADGTSNMRQLCSQGSTANNSYINNVDISKSTFEYFGKVGFSGYDNSLNSTNIANGIRIDGCTFVNSHFEFSKCAHVTMTNNEIYVDELHDSYNNIYQQSVLNASNALIYITKSNDIDIQGNKIYVYETLNNNLKNGIVIRPLSADTDNLDYWEIRNVNISNNLLWGFKVGIGGNIPAALSSYADGARSLMGWNVEGNRIITTSESVSNSAGAIVPPGMIFKGNTIWARANSANSFAICVYGVKDDNTGNIDRLVGGVAINNSIYCADNTRPIRLTANSSGAVHNLVSLNNTIIGGYNNEVHFGAASAVNSIFPEGINTVNGSYRIDIELGIQNTWVMPVYKRYIRDVGLRL